MPRKANSEAQQDEAKKVSSDLVMRYIVVSPGTLVAHFFGFGRVSVDACGHNRLALCMEETRVD